MSIPLIFPYDSPRARRTDPLTSHLAADLSDTAWSRQEVLAIIRQHQPVSDEAIRQIAAQRWEDGRCEKRFSPERLRTARAELVNRGAVVKAGEDVTSRGRRCTIWGLA